VRIEQIDLTFMNIPLVRPEVWSHGSRSSYTVGLVEVHTDAGITGIGDFQAFPDPDVIRSITEQMSGLVIGESALAPGRIVARIMGSGWWALHRAAALVLGGIEIACWDAMGKHLDQPISTFFGGAMRDSFESMFYVQGEDDLSIMIELAKDGVARGYGTVYYKVGIEEERDVELVIRTREALGDGPKIRIDANEAWTPGTAVRILRRISPAVIEYVEQPNLMYDIDGLAHIRAASGVAVGANQASWGQYAVLDIIRKNAADVIMSDPHQEGGLLATKKVMGMCEAAGLAFVNHAFSATTTTLTAHLQLMSTSTACLLATQGHPDFLADDYVTTPLDYSTGTLPVGSGPGLGLELDRDKVRRFHAAFEAEGYASCFPDRPSDPIAFVPGL
jgi:L-alanine-DL-glutamate epimerase-like enolase superfamily enzyme